MEDRKKCLNLGSGSDYIKSNNKEIWVNLEKDKILKVDVYCNLNKGKLPFKNNEFDYIFFNHVIEHLSPELELMGFFDEISRVLKKDGILEMNCPHFSGWNAFGMFHKRYFHFRNFISLPQFEVVKAGLYTRLKHDTLGKNKKSVFLFDIVNAIIDKFANLNPLLCERLWCYWVGGFKEMRFILKNKGVKASKYESMGVADK